MAQVDFQDRLARLNADHSVRAQVQTQKRKQRAAQNGPEWIENAKYPLSFVVAFLVGAISILIARYVSSVMVGVPQADADMDTQMIIDGVLAGVIVWFLRMAIKSDDKEMLAAQSVGIWVALTMMHNLVHLVPDMWAVIYGADWVAMILETTSPSSIRIGSNEIPLTCI